MRLTPRPSTQPTHSPPPTPVPPDPGRQRTRPRAAHRRRIADFTRPGHQIFELPSARGTIFLLIAAAVVGAVLVCLLADPAQAAAPAPVFVSNVGEVFTRIRNWLLGILAGLATMILTYGGVRYLLANGDPAEVEKAKNAVRNAGKGYVLAALAPLLVEILRGIVEA